MAIKIKDIVRGTTRNIDVTFSQQDGTAYDLTGASVYFAATQESAPTDDTGAAIDVEVTSHTDATSGETRITLQASDTDVDAGTYNVGVQAVLDDGTVIEDTGKVKILQDYKKAIV